jgi:hypothetical protein
MTETRQPTTRTGPRPGDKVWINLNPPVFGGIVSEVLWEDGERIVYVFGEYPRENEGRLEDIPYEEFDGCWTDKFNGGWRLLHYEL